MIKIVFFGTPEYVVPVVDKLNRTFRNLSEKGLIAVVTQNPKRSGRGNKLEYSEVDHWAHKNNVTKIYELNEVPEADLGVVASYGKIIPEDIINKFKHGILNIHPSKLPDLRGASPIQATLTKGYTQTTVTIIKMDEKIDHGPIVSSFNTDINKSDTAETLKTKLFLESADFIANLIPNYIANKIKLKTQNHSKATFTTLVSKQDSFLDQTYLNKLIKGNKVSEKLKLNFIKNFELEINPESINRLIKAMTPWPVVWSLLRINATEGQAEIKRLKILKAHVSEDNKKLILDEVQLEGKNPVAWKQFLEGHKLS